MKYPADFQALPQRTQRPIFSVNFNPTHDSYPHYCTLAASNFNDNRTKLLFYDLPTNHKPKPTPLN